MPESLKVSETQWHVCSLCSENITFSIQQHTVPGSPFTPSSPGRPSSPEKKMIENIISIINLCYSTPAAGCESLGFDWIFINM